MMSGYFGFGVESSSKPYNAGNLVRSTHAFGGSFFVFIQPVIDYRKVRQSDTSGAIKNFPVYQYDNAKEMVMPDRCALVGIELTDEAIELPSFRHPKSALYLLGPEKGHLSEAAQSRCDFMIKIPMKFCVNVGVAGAIVMYDRLLTRGRFPDRPVSPSSHLKQMRQNRL